LSDQAVISATNFLTNVMLARYMGLREFGVFVLAWMSVLFVNSLQTAMIVAPMMSIGPKQEREDRPFYYGSVVFQELVLVTFCFLLVFAGLRTLSRFFHHPELEHLALPLACAAFAYQMQDFMRRYFFATQQCRRALVNDMLSYLTQLPILYLAHRTGRLDSEVALWAMAGTSLLGMALGWFWMERLEFDWKCIRTVSQRHWMSSRWLTGSALMIWTSSNLFLLAAPAYWGASAAGVLKGSQNLLGVTHIWYQGLENVVPVESARQLRIGGAPAMLRYTRSILIKWGALTLVYLGVLAAAPAFWLRLAYGAEMMQYGHVLRLYALLYLIVFVGGPMRAGLQALECTAPIFWSYLAMTGLAFVFAFPLAKRLGLSGSLLGLIGAMVLFQTIVGVSLVRQAGKAARLAVLPH
jgi:O-antigen/teichoic acid export membrane protein